MRQNQIENGKSYVVRIQGSQIIVTLVAIRDVGDAFRGRGYYYKRLEYTVTDEQGKEYYLKSKDFVREA